MGNAIVEPGTADLSLVPGNDRRDIQGKQVLIKLNCVRRNREIIGTHPESLHGILDFLKPIPTCI